MPGRLAAHQAAIVAALLFLLPGQTGAGEEGAAPALRLAALSVVPDHAPPRARPNTALNSKWRALRERMRQDERTVALCRRDPAACPSEAATQFMAIADVALSREGRARIGEINRAVNLAIRPVPDEKRHGADVWTSPLATLAAGQGDCEDYAIAKLALLWAAGIPERDTRFVIVRDARAGEDHALAMVRHEGRWLALDNRRFTLIDADYLAYRPLFLAAGEDLRAFADRSSWREMDWRELDRREPDGDSEAERSANLGAVSGAGGAPVLL
jgi:predicted transglutaminase-like cysteine proteinase